MKSLVTILSTRILKPELVAKAKTHGIQIIEHDFIATRAVDFDYQDVASVECFVFTSANAVRTVVDAGISLHDKKIACLSGKTKQTLLDYGVPITFEATDARTLAYEIVHSSIKAVAFFCGNISREELPNALSEAKISVHRIVVYETILKPHHVKQPLDGILFFSPSAVDSFLSSNELGITTRCFCIGATTAGYVRTKTTAFVHSAQFPSQEELVNQLIAHYTYVHVKE